MSTLLINETFLNTFLRTQKSGFALKSVFLSGFTLLRAFLSAQKSAQGPTQPLCRSLQTSSNKSKAVKSSNTTLSFATAVESLQGGSAKIQINTLSPYLAFGGGIFKMTDVKRMTAKDDFLKMPLKDRNCEVELYEDCRTRKLFAECKCAPCEASGFQVGAF